MKRRNLACVLVVCFGLSTSACGGSHRAILYKGQLVHFGTKRVRVSDTQARVAGARAPNEWRTELEKRANAAPGQRFRNLGRSTFRARLEELARRDHFAVKRLLFEHPRELAPRVVIATKHYLAVAHAVPRIEQRLDPRSGGRWAYEGFYLEAQDERGIPFVIVYNAVRGNNPSGAQWARSEELYPFEHS